MPTEYIKKMADKHDISQEKAEKLWSKAKNAAADQGHSGEYDYITGIFKRMIGEETEPTNTRDETMPDTEVVKKRKKPCRRKVDETSCKETVKEDSEPLEFWQFKEKLADILKAKEEQSDKSAEEQPTD